MTNSSIKLPVMAFLAIYLGLLAVGVSHAGTITDNFSGATINTRLWQPFAESEHQRVTQQNGELLIQIDQNSSGMGGVEAKFLLKGDFDVTVDYCLVTQPTNNGVRLGIEGDVASGEVWYFEARRFSLRPDDPYPNAKDFYHGGFNYVDVVDVATTDGQGSLRVTRVGKWLRLLRIDELPQLWNVLWGDLSFVGPRPELPPLASQYSARIPFYDARHLVAPGLTGWAQLHHDREPHHETDTEATRTKLAYDLYYLKHRSLVLDVRILFQTVRVLLAARGT